MSGPGMVVFNRVVKYLEVKFEGASWYMIPSDQRAGLSLPPGYLYASSETADQSLAITITRSDGKVLTITPDGTNPFECAFGEETFMFHAEAGKPSDAPFK